jgi:dipeptidyl aminopeptidase/acylaminoacyl peptidase
MRLRQYPGSPLLIEVQLESGPNYYRYLTSYLSEGLKIYALLTIPGDPPPATGWPVIVFNHGYIPPEEYRTTERYVAYVDYFARNGYIVFRPDYRGHGFSEGAARGGYGYPDYTVDVLNAVSTIKRYPAADPERIGMWGHSMGGYITLRCMVISNEIKAGVIWAGVVASYPDLVTKWQGRSIANIPEIARRWRVELAEQYGTPAENPTFWSSISANSFLDDLSGPIQLHHGTADEDVPVEFSATLYDELIAADQAAEYHVYEGDNHNISENFKIAAKRSLDFFDKYVEQAETP